MPLNIPNQALKALSNFTSSEKQFENNLKPIEIINTKKYKTSDEDYEKIKTIHNETKEISKSIPIDILLSMANQNDQQTKELVKYSMKHFWGEHYLSRTHKFDNHGRRIFE